MDEEIDASAVIAHLEQENEALRKKLAILYMKQRSLWQQLLDTGRAALKFFREMDTFYFLKWIILIEGAISLIITIIRLP